MTRGRTILSLALRAASLTVPLITGYAFGVALLISWMVVRESRSPGSRRGFESSVMFYRYRFDGQGVVNWPPPSDFLTVLFLFSLAFTLVALASRMGFPGGYFGNNLFPRGPEHQRHRFRRCWFGAFSRVRTAPLGLLIACLLLGIGGSVFGLGLDQLIREVRVRYWIRFVPQPLPGREFQPVAVLGWLTWSEILWFVPAIGWAVYWWYVRPARRIMLASGPITRRWCRHCGFLLGLGKQRKNTAPARCPECGKETGPVPN